jgi:hypothetical protein
MAKEEHFEVSFSDPITDRRIAFAHSAEQAKELAQGFVDEHLEDVQVHKITTSREPHDAGLTAVV